MKNLILVITVLLCSGSKYAQVSKWNVIKVNTLLPLSNSYDLQYERVMNNYSSIQFGLGMGKISTNSLNDFQELFSDYFGDVLHNPTSTNHRTQTFSANFGYRHYTRDHIAPQGFYIGPTIQYLNYKERFYAMEQALNTMASSNLTYIERVIERKLKLTNFEIQLGYQFLFKNGIVLNPNVGPSFVIGKTDKNFQKEDENLTGFGLNFGIEIGLAF